MPTSLRRPSTCPPEKLEKELESRNGHGLERTGEFWTAAWLDWLTTPWERARARRVNRLIATADIEKAALENWQRGSIRSTLPNGPETDFPYDLSSTPLAKLLSADVNAYLAPHDLNEVGRRALVQVMALRAWQLRHNGQFPDSLDKLVPEELPSLPIDPYSGRIFGYVRSGGQPLVPLGKALASVGVGTASKVATTGYWLLYSVGRDKQDNRALITRGPASQPTSSFQFLPCKATALWIRNVDIRPAANRGRHQPIVISSFSATCRHLARRLQRCERVLRVSPRAAYGDEACRPPSQPKRVAAFG